MFGTVALKVNTSAGDTAKGGSFCTGQAYDCSLMVGVGSEGQKRDDSPYESKSGLRSRPSASNSASMSPTRSVDVPASGVHEALLVEKIDEHLVYVHGCSRVLTGV